MVKTALTYTISFSVNLPPPPFLSLCIRLLRLEILFLLTTDEPVVVNSMYLCNVEKATPYQTVCAPLHEGSGSLYE